MAQLVVAQGSDYVELEGRRLRAGDLVWVPLASSNGLVASAFAPGVFVGADHLRRQLRVLLVDGATRWLEFDAGVRRREPEPRRSAD